MSDQSQVSAPEQASPPTGIEDYFGEDQSSDDVNQEQVTPSEAGEQPSEEKAKETPSEKTDAKKPPTTEKKVEEDVKKDAQSNKFEVGGREFETLEDAIEAVNRINGDNTRMTGDLKTLTKSKVELESKVTELETLLDRYKEANIAWQSYYDGDGDKPEQKLADVEKLVEDKVKQIKKQEKDIEVKTQFALEIDEIFAEEDFKEVQPFFEELVNEFDGTPKVSPKKLYKRAQIAYKASLDDQSPKDIEQINKLVDEKVQKQLAKIEAAKNSTQAGGSGEPSKPNTLPPEVQDYFDQHI